MSNKRIRGVALHRAILIGSTSTPLSPAEKFMAPPDHTHKWTVAVRSAASNPLPSTSAVSNKVEPSSTSSASAPAASSSSTATISTRGRDQEMDYHKMVGGKDDISHFIKRVQFKLHDTYAQPTRNIDKPPFSVTETGWGEFEIQVKIFFVPEANEKPVTSFHHLKLHPWVKVSLAPAPAASEATRAEATETAAATVTAATEAVTSIDAPSGEPQAHKEPSEQVKANDAMEMDPPMEGPPATTLEQAASTPLSAPPAPPPVVHSWQYDEIVFPEPTEAFYEILTAHPPTPFPATSAQAFADPSAYRSYQSAVEEAFKEEAEAPAQPLVPPHPLHSSSGFLFDAMSQEAQQGEADRLDLARISAVRELEKGREQLIKAEKALKEMRSKLNVTTTTVNGSNPPLPSS